MPVSASYRSMLPWTRLMPCSPWIAPTSTCLSASKRFTAHGSTPSSSGTVNSSLRLLNRCSNRSWTHVPMNGSHAADWRLSHPASRAARQWRQSVPSSDGPISFCRLLGWLVMWSSMMPRISVHSSDSAVGAGIFPGAVWFAAMTASRSSCELISCPPRILRRGGPGGMPLGFPSLARR